MMAGHETTLPITRPNDYHASSVVRAIERALVVVIYLLEVINLIQKSFTFFHSNNEESGGHAVKLEGGKEIKESIKNIKRWDTGNGPSGFNTIYLQIWNLYRSCKEEEEADKLIEDAQLLEDWAVLLY
jgi:3-methyl-2-oxobutanoate hydroxymethyltransferase